MTAGFLIVLIAASCVVSGAAEILYRTARYVRRRRWLS